MAQLRRIVVSITTLSLLFSPFVSNAQMIITPNCEEDPNNAFCQGYCRFAPELPWCQPQESEPKASVMFIPGLQGSRLYIQNEYGDEEQLWEPGDVKQLFMDETGKSIRDDIYTRDIIDAVFGYNIYKKFSGFMDDLVAEDTITAWQPVAYDWRYDAADLVPKMTNKLEQLAAENDSITVITHSYGGLIAKAVLQELSDQKAAGQSELIDKIDRVILVGTPQLGTPKTIASLLHGYDVDLGKGLILSGAMARALAQHMPSAFNLLPSDSYFNAVLEPPVEFDESADLFAPFQSMYGSEINSTDELRSLLTGGNGNWQQPNLGDLIAPLVLKNHFIDTALANQTDWQNWTLPEHIEVVQIAGWGLDTVKTARYTAKRIYSCGEASPVFCRDGYKLDPEPVFTVDGDETVVTPSAVAMSGKKYYVNLYKHNRELARLRRNRSHADIFEVNDIQELIRNLLSYDDSVPSNISATKPVPADNNKRLRVSVHSPVSLKVCSEEVGEDGQPLCTGLASKINEDITRKVEDLPNSYYLQFGEGKYVGFSADEPHTIELKGEGTGTFDLKIDEVAGETVVDTILYQDVPVFAGIEGELTLQDVAGAGNLRLNMYGENLNLEPGEQVTTRQLVGVLDEYLDGLRLKKGAKKSTEAHLKNVKKFLNKKKMKKSHALESQLKNIVKKIDKEVGKTVSAEQAETVADIAAIIKERI